MVRSRGGVARSSSCHSHLRKGSPRQWTSRWDWLSPWKRKRRWLISSNGIDWSARPIGKKGGSFTNGAPRSSASQAAATQYSDEAWSRRAGNVSGQHVGRLRRVFERFGAVSNSYPDLYWSHFQAALDWNDAEMWLEGAVQSGWSVSQMRSSRWLAMGAPDELRPSESDVISAELDEDFSADRQATGEIVDPAERPRKARRRNHRARL